LILMVAFAAGPAAGDIAERIKPVGNVCVEGEECGVATAASGASDAAAADSGPRSGQQVYDESCNMCHGAGVAGAPKVGDTVAWTDRIGQGIDVLYTHAIEGINTMPPMGMCAACSEEEIKLAVDYMVEASQ
jgi:cytochrome c5